MHVVQYPQRVLHTRARTPQIIRRRLDPAKGELRALLDHLEKRTGELEIPTARSRPNDSPPRLTLKILAPITRKPRTFSNLPASTI